MCKVRRLHLDLTSVMGGPTMVDIWCEHGRAANTFRLHMQINKVEIYKGNLDVSRLHSKTAQIMNSFAPTGKQKYFLVNCVLLEFAKVMQVLEKHT